MSGAYVFGYAMLGALTGVMAFAALVLLLDAEKLPSGQREAVPALLFLSGLLWPMTLAVGALYGAVRLAVVLGRSFVALARWLYWRNRDGNVCALHDDCRAADARAARERAS